MALYPNGYAQRASNVVDHTKCGSGGALASFPVVFRGHANLATVANGGFSQSLGLDVIFTSDAAGAVVLSAELVPSTYNATTGAGEWHVNLGTGPSQVNSTTNATFYVFVGKASVSSSSTTAAWNTNFKLVHHYSTSPLTATDSTSSGYNGVVTGAVAGTGQIGRGAYFFSTGSATDIINVTGLTSFGRPISWEFWAQDLGTDGTVIQAASYDGNFLIYCDYFWPDKRLSVYISATDGFYTALPTDHAWHHYVVTVDGSGARAIYRDGAANSALDAVGTTSSPTLSTAIKIGNGAIVYSGVLDELRLSAAALSASWANASYHTQNDLDFYTSSAFTASAVATIVKTIGTSSRQYSILNAWADDAPANLTTAEQWSATTFTGTFVHGETVTGGGLTGKFLATDGSSYLAFGVTSGAAVAFGTLTGGTSGATCVLSANTHIGVIWRGEAYNDSEFTVTNLAALYVSGLTTSTACYLDLTAAAGQSFQDHAAVRSNALTYNQAKGVGIRELGTSNYGERLVHVECNIHLSRLQFWENTGASGFVEFSDIVSLTDCLFVGGALVHVRGGSGLLTATNCVFLQHRSAVFGDGDGVFVGGGGATFLGCTFVFRQDITVGTTGAVRADYSGTITFKSCAMFGWANVVRLTRGGLSLAGQNNATNLASGLPSTNAHYNVTWSATTPFVRSDNSGTDLRAIPGTDLIANGFRDSTNAPNDISAFARAANPTVGAWELPALLTLTVGGTLTPGGVLVVAPKKTVTGAMLSAGALVRIPAVVKAGTIAPIGTLLKQVPPRTLTGAIATITGAIATASARTLAGAITAGGTVTPFLRRVTTGTLLLVGAVAQAPRMTLSGVCAAAGVAARGSARFVGGVIGFVGAIVTGSSARVHSPVRLLHVTKRAPKIKNLRRK